MGLDCDMSNILISVIVPVYNVEGYLKKCIESICHQTYENLEIILVDDGSTDGSGFLCDAYAKKDSRIKAIHKTNGGLSDARNTGMEIATGEWWTFVDSDDYLAPNTAATLLRAAVENCCEIAVCNMVRVYEDGAQEPFYCPATKPTIWADEQRFKTLKQPSVCNKLFYAGLFEGVRFPKGKYYEDTFVYHILVYRASQIVLTGLNGYYYLSRRESILGQPRFTDKYFDFVEAVHERATFLLNHGVSHYGEEACLGLYAAVVNSTKNIRKTPQNVERFQRMWEWYGLAYQKLISSPNTSIKQKLRLFLLKYVPEIHNKLY